jgi:hypothetical protein
MGQRYPQPITAAMLADANVNDGKPRYSSNTDWSGATTIGEDPGLPTAANQAFSTANVALARSGGGANEPDYTPRNAERQAGRRQPVGRHGRRGRRRPQPRIRRAWPALPGGG